MLRALAALPPSQRAVLVLRYIAGLPRVGQGYRFTRIADGWLVESASGAPACCAGRPLPVYYVADGSRTAIPLGSGYSASAASSPGELWLLRYASRGSGSEPRRPRSG